MERFSKKHLSSNNLIFRKIPLEELIEVHKLAYEIWPDFFRSILSQNQIEYMLQWMYGLEPLENQFDQGDAFYLLEQQNIKIGYVHLHEISKTKLKLQKIYLRKELHGKGIGKYMMDQILHIARELKYESIELQVNRENSAVDFYKDFGFIVEYSKDFEIGEGFYMNDFVMSYTL